MIMISKLEDIQKKICLKIKLERNKRNLSQEKLCELCDITQNSLVAIENFRSSPKLSTIIKIANAFDITVSELTDISKIDLEISSYLLSSNKK